MTTGTGLRAAAYDRYKVATELPLMVLALLLVPLLVWPIAVDTSPAMAEWLTRVDWLIWSVFAADYLVGLSLAPDRRRYVRTEWPNLLLVVLPVLRPLRVMRSTKALRLLRLSRAASALSEVAQEGRRLLVRHHLHYVATWNAASPSSGRAPGLGSRTVKIVTLELVAPASQFRSARRPIDRRRDTPA